MRLPPTRFFNPGDTMSDTLATTPTTVKAYLRPIDAAGLATFAAKGKANPGQVNELLKKKLEN